MNRRASWVSGAALTAMLIGFVAPAAAQVSAEQAAEIDELVGAWVEENDVVGLQVAVGMGDDVAWAGAYGMADLEDDVPLTDESRFRTASISKWMTATAAMRLVELGQLDLDTPVQEYCSAYPEKRWPLTMRNLLRHRGGVRHYWGANGEDPQTPEARRDLAAKREEEQRGMATRYVNVVAPVRRFADDPLLFQPGTEFHYTSHGYRLVGCVLRGAAGTSYHEIMQTHVFGPAGMTLTRDDDAHAIIPGRVRGYVRTPGGELRRSQFRDVSENLPAGGHVSTASDLVRFGLAWNNGELISEESMAAQAARPDGVEGDGHYGFGINVGSPPAANGRRIYVHTGSQAETRTWLVLDPEAGIAVSTMSNDEEVPLMAQIIFPIFDLLDSP